jgi:hypothetical protein
MAPARANLTRELRPEFIAADTVVEQSCENGAVPYTRPRIRRGASSSHRSWAQPSAGVPPSLPCGAGRMTASTGLPGTALRSQRYSNRVDNAESLRRCSPATTPGFHVLAPSDDRRAGDSAQRSVIFQTGECEELRHIGLASATGFRIGNIGEPFQLRRNIREWVELGDG